MAIEPTQVNDKLGISLNEFTQALVESYQKGFTDAIEILKLSQKNINLEKMQHGIKELLIKQGKIKTDW
ncbi:MAG: hypothetical protein WC188_03210 [Candidatus Caldatribacteriota bacterium]